MMAMVPLALSLAVTFSDPSFVFGLRARIFGQEMVEVDYIA